MIEKSVPQSSAVNLNELMAQTASLLAVREQQRKEIADNKLALSTLPPSNHITPYMDPRRRGERRMQKPESYKTVICQAWLESKTCTFAENCRFAHGEEELRPSFIEPRQNNKYKTKLCDKYTTTGLCPYGKRCLFIHPDNGPNAYIRSDKLYEVSQRHALADLRDQMEHHIMTGGQSTVPDLSKVTQSLDMLPRPSTPDEPAAKMPLGPTPVSTRGPKYELPPKNVPEEEAGNLPPSCWRPFDPSSFFSLDNLNMASRPVSPFESMLIEAAATAGVLPFTMIGKQSTPGGVSGYSSAGSSAGTPYQDPDTSPESLLAKSVINPLLIPQREELYSPMLGFDKLAEEMAKQFELW
ncbi:hypothetical protein GCK72_008852 [Caenorhabditis remanei]|uniref:Uncharacterized protein n=1 Tax=Caenorhabditis remanei TaxID=31234 RepID=A0A2P4V5F8_CAERE|nr:hypothetical protein GCK72_008852 [Caenorhabditis remanei]KAF1760603.1 hypothetical protein GCK72_008852 [Caenorhabditis remanei]